MTVHTIHTILSSHWDMSSRISNPSRRSGTVTLPPGIAHSFAVTLAENAGKYASSTLNAETPEEAIEEIMMAVLNDHVIHSGFQHTKDALWRASKGQGYTLKEVCLPFSKPREYFFRGNYVQEASRPRAEKLRKSAGPRNGTRTSRDNAHGTEVFIPRAPARAGSTETRYAPSQPSARRPLRFDLSTFLALFPVSVSCASFV